MSDVLSQRRGVCGLTYPNDLPKTNAKVANQSACKMSDVGGHFSTLKSCKLHQVVLGLLVGVGERDGRERLELPIGVAHKEIAHARGRFGRLVGFGMCQDWRVWSHTACHAASIHDGIWRGPV